LLYRLASNVKPTDEAHSIEEMIEENVLSKPIFQEDKKQFLEMAIYFCLNSPQIETTTSLLNELS